MHNFGKTQIINYLNKVHTNHENSLSLHPPFGMQITSRTMTSTTKGYRFGFNGMERDDEVKGVGNSLDFGARIYDSRLGRWFSPDPLNQFNSLYLAMGNTPIIAYDVDGMWVPVVSKDGKLQLVAEEGDNQVTLLKYFNSQDVFKKSILQFQKVYKAGDIQPLNENLVQSKLFKHAHDNPEIYAERGAIFDKWKTNYNCFSFAKDVVEQTNNIVSSGYSLLTYPDDYEKWVNTNFNILPQVNLKEQGVPGETILIIKYTTLGNATDIKKTNTIQHTAVYYGTTKDGEILVLSKNGVDFEPEVMTLKSVLALYSPSIIMDKMYGSSYSWYKLKPDETASEEAVEE